MFTLFRIPIWIFLTRLSIISTFLSTSIRYYEGLWLYQTSSDFELVYIKLFYSLCVWSRSFEKKIFFTFKWKTARGCFTLFPRVTPYFMKLFFRLNRLYPHHIKKPLFNLIFFYWEIKAVLFEMGVRVTHWAHSV